MKLQKIEVYNYRNFSNFTLDLGEQFTVIKGKNGRGKTNLIEAIYLLTAPRSFRGSLLGELPTWGSKACEITGIVFDSLGEQRLTVKINNSRKELLVNDNKVKSSFEFIGKLVSVCFSPDDIELVKGGNKVRLQLLDKHLVDIYPNLLSSLAAYNRALKSKNKLLGEKDLNRATLEPLIEPWNEVLAIEACKIQEFKYVIVEKLGKLLSEIYQRFTNDNLDLKVELKTEIEKNISKEEYFGILSRVFSKEILRGKSIFGIHRDDLILTLNNQSAKAFASQGQSKSIALSLKLAFVILIKEIRGFSPLVLLDDIKSELDEERFHKLIEYILQFDSQTVITTTEFDGFKEEIEGKERSVKIVEITGS